MKIGDAKDFLDGLLAYDSLYTYNYDEVNFDLSRVKCFLRDLGVDLSAMKVVTVVGSKGKSTVAALVAEYLALAGVRVGSFTSPYLLDVCESFKVGGVQIDEDEFVGLVESMVEVYRLGFEGKITRFEFLFALALCFFQKRACEVVVLEAGMGGLLDVVNVVDAHEVLLTRVELEHTKFLGESYEDILRHKLGVLRSGTRLFVGIQDPRVKALVVGCTDQGRSFFVENEDGGLSDEVVARGKAFCENVLLAKKFLMSFCTKDAEGKSLFDERLFLKMVEGVFVVGRLDLREVDGCLVVFDVSHTVESVRNLMDYIDRRFGVSKKVFLMALLQDKDLKGIFELLKERYGPDLELNLTSVHGERGALERHYQEVLQVLEVDFEYDSDPVRVFDRLKKECSDDKVLVVCGSNYLVARILANTKSTLRV